MSEHLLSLPDSWGHLNLIDVREVGSRTFVLACAFDPLAWYWVPLGNWCAHHDPEHFRLPAGTRMAR